MFQKIRTPVFRVLPQLLATACLLLAVMPGRTQSAPFIPESFSPPLSFSKPGYKLAPLGPALARHDYDAYMSSIEHLRTTFSSNGKWPHEGLTMEDAMKDVEGEESRFQQRKAFTYAVLTPDGSRELGCLYIRPSNKAGYDAQAAMWVTKAEFDKGFEKQLLADMKQWLKESWPFQEVAWPRREISAAEWAALPPKLGGQRGTL